MKRDLRSIILFVAAAGILGFASCKKNYHCQCSFNNTIQMTTDLGSQTKDDAKAQCDAYDSTVTGEKWTCVIY